MKQKTIPPLNEVTRTHLPTADAAYYLSRAPQTMRRWHCNGGGPITPVRINGRLAWPVAKIRELLAGV